MRKIGVFRTSDGSKVQETLDVSKRAAAKITPDMMLGNREASSHFVWEDNQGC